MNADRRHRAMKFESLESLDGRLAPSGLVGPGVPEPPRAIVHASPSAALTPAQLVADRGGQALGSIYREFLAYQDRGSQGAFVSALSHRISFQDTSVGVVIRGRGGNFDALVKHLQSEGLRVTSTLAAYHYVQGYLPISQLPTLAGDATLATIAPAYRPILRR